MRRALPIILVLVFAGLGFYISRTLTVPPSPPGQTLAIRTKPDHTVITTPVVENNEFKLKPGEVQITPGGDPIAKTLQALMKAADDKKSESAIPAGTELVSVKVKDGLAVVDLSDSFNLLNKKGDTTQSLAQQQLRAALAQFPEVKKMRVTVNGKVFEDGHSGPWDDIPVRDDNAGSGEAEDGSAV
jgi:spore germination protein GerM